MRAADVMSAKVVTVTARTSVVDVARVLQRHGFGAVPVVDDQARVLGIVSRAELAGVVPAGHLADPPPVDLPGWGHRSTTAADVMHSPVVCVDAGEDVRNVAWLLVTRGLTRVPVLHDGRLVGIIARGDLLRRLRGMPAAGTTPPHPRPTRPRPVAPPAPRPRLLAWWMAPPTHLTVAPLERSEVWPFVGRGGRAGSHLN